MRKGLGCNRFECYGTSSSRDNLEAVGYKGMDEDSTHTYMTRNPSATRNYIEQMQGKAIHGIQFSRETNGAYR